MAIKKFLIQIIISAISVFLILLLLELGVPSWGCALLGIAVGRTRSNIKNDNQINLK